MPRTTKTARKLSSTQATLTPENKAEPAATESLDLPAPFMVNRDPSKFSPRDAIYLQRVIGNQAVQRIISQKKHMSSAAPKSPGVSPVPSQIGVIARDYLAVPGQATWKDDTKLDIRYKR